MITVHSSHGEFEVKEYDHGRLSELSRNTLETANGSSINIHSFDLEEWEHYHGKKLKDGDVLDILDLGYWWYTRSKSGKKGFTSNTYEPPVEDWRIEIKQNLTA